MWSMLLAVAADVAKAALPKLVAFLWEKAHEPTVAQDAAPDDERRQRLLAAVRRHG